MPSVKIKDDLYKDISEYCKLNDFNIVDYVNEKLKNAIINDKYGNIPFGTIPGINVKEGPLVAEEIVTNTQENQFNQPTGETIVACMDKIVSVEQVSKQTTAKEENNETINTNKEEFKPKKRRL